MLLIAMEMCIDGFELLNQFASIVRLLGVARNGRKPNRWWNEGSVVEDFTFSYLNRDLN